MHRATICHVLAGYAVLLANSPSARTHALNLPPSKSATSRRQTLGSLGLGGGLATFTGLNGWLGSPRGAIAVPSDQQFQDVGTQAPPPDGQASFRTLPSGVKVKTFTEGTGDSVKAGTKVQIQCNGRLLNLNGVKFYNTKDNDPDGFGARPLEFEVGAGTVVAGLDQGVVGMKKGEVRRIIVPPEVCRRV